MNEGFLVIAGFFGLFILGMPVAFAILVPSVVYIAVGGIPMAMVAQRVLYALDSFPLVAVPVFIFVGNLMNAAGITERLFKFADVLVGRLWGGLAQVNVFASLIFSGVSGAALADVGGLGRVEIKAMSDKGFPLPFSASVTAASAIIGPIFPPSIPIIIYASVTSVSAVQLLMAGIVPALIAVVLLMATVAVLSLRRDYPRALHWPSPRRLWRAFWPAAPALMAPIILIGGMLSGHFTPTETSAVAVVYVLVIGTVFYRSMGPRFVVKAAVETVRSTAAILFIVAAAAMFGWILTVEGVPRDVAGWFGALGDNPWLLLLVVNVIFLVAGMFVDSTTATLLLVPIIAPPVVAAGIDPVHLGIVIIFNLMFGTVTPPFGLSLFLLSNMTGLSFTRLAMAMVPFYPALVLALILLTFVPGLSLWIPSMIR
ncbi:TRAP transporter large permease [Acuticoccus sp. I52.16.1]|uniref:TRAP transporter large permease n=1 Tax=Acuticoccus sp. I52.16.1 TaxID=2928472 RepID=UPI001FD01111|nr:TRAP transporter large permease [Acuticoccus sp. I52.16.1]UOM35759.1 TRAP transporter large permease [Acuticoccus sp. I52.16.1]